MVDTRLANRVVLVTGSSGGIGGEVASAFFREGARVVAHFGQHGERARRLAEQLGPNCVALGGDLTQEAEVDGLFQKIESHFGPVEIAVCNAGKWPVDDVPLAEMTLERWNATIAVDLTSVFLTMRTFLRGVALHKIAEPTAVLIGSTAAIFGEAGHADYAAAKAGLTYGLARSLKNEICRIAPRGRVNVVCPGWTFTPMTQRFANDPAQVRRVLQTIPLRKVGRAHDVAMSVVYLASHHLSDHVSGQVLTVSGGMEGRMLYDPDQVDPTQA